MNIIGGFILRDVTVKFALTFSVRELLGTNSYNYTKAVFSNVSGLQHSVKCYFESDESME